MTVAERASFGEHQPAEDHRRTRLTHEEIAARAAYVLRENDLGTMTKAAPQLYPHMWSWDAAFIAIGLAKVSVSRAVIEMETLLRAQWRSGMIPHIVFSDSESDYFPGPDRWGCADLTDEAPRRPATSGICQPPVHAIAVQRIVAAGRREGSAGKALVEEFLERTWDPLMRWHRWLAVHRDPENVGRLTVHHSWESGMDNSPRWDAPYSRVSVGSDLPPYERRDTHVVGDATHRPSNREYDRYLWLVEEMRRVRYDDAAIASTSSFAVKDVFMSALFAVACDVLADLGEDLAGRPDDVAQLRAWSQRFQLGVAATVDPASGLARDRDLRGDEWLTSETVAGFAPLLCGGLDGAAERRLLAMLDSPRWSGHKGFLAAVPPSVSPLSDSYRSREYWRGPQWPVMAWLLSWAFARRGWTAQAAQLRGEGLRLVADGTFAEYYEATSGEPLGSSQQSWTAAVALDWLC